MLVFLGLLGFPPLPIPGVNIKVPSGGTIMEKKKLFLWFVEMFWELLRFWGIWGVLNGPPTPPTIPGVNVKVPFQGKEYGKNVLGGIFCNFCEKSWNNANILKICMCGLLPTGENMIFSKSVYLYIHHMTGLYIHTLFNNDSNK